MPLNAAESSFLLRLARLVFGRGWGMTFFRVPSGSLAVEVWPPYSPSMQIILDVGDGPGGWARSEWGSLVNAYDVMSDLRRRFARRYA